MRVPCYKCEERHKGCHCSCKDYAEYRIIIQRKLDAEKRETMLDSYDMDAKKKFNRL